jgi:hypothetical protein
LLLKIIPVLCHKTYIIWTNVSHITVTTSVCVYMNILLWTYDG